MARLHGSTRQVNGADRTPPRFTTTYRPLNGQFTASHTYGLTAGPGSPIDHSELVVSVPCRTPWREFIGALHQLADAVEHNLLEGPADFLALEEPDTEPEDAA